MRSEERRHNDVQGSMFQVQRFNSCRTLNIELVAVGTALTGGPPHGSGRAELPHPALALGNNAKAHQRMRMITPLTPFTAGCLTYPLKRAGHVFPALCPGHVTLKRLPLGQSPFLHCLRSRTGGFVRQLRKYYETVRLPVPVHHRRASLDFPMRPAAPSAAGGHRISRFSCEVFPYVLGVSDRAGSRRISRWRYAGWGLPLLLTASAPRRDVLSRLNTRPARAPVNASTRPLQTAPHDSGSVWVASPSPYDSFIHYTSPV